MDRPPAQLDLDLSGAGQSAGPRPGLRPRALLAAGRAHLWRSARGVALWAPLAVLLQIGWLGVRPAWLESRRLAREEAEMQVRLDALLAQRGALERDAQKLADPIYRERVLRSLGAAGVEPLTLSATGVAPEGR
jgi:hypothetical protein